MGMNFKNIVFIGNCQVAVLSEIYKSQIAPFYDHDVFCIDINWFDPAGSLKQLEKLRGADVVVDQVFDTPGKLNPEELRPGTVRYLVPNLRGDFLWPFGSVAHPRTAEFSNVNPYGAEVGDNFLNRMILKGVPPDRAVAEYIALDINRVRDLDRLFELVMDRQRRRDSLARIHTAALIENRFRDERLFQSPGHPTGTLLTVIARSVFSEIGVPDDEINRALAAQPPGFWPGHATPIHWSVIKHFCLSFVNSASVYGHASEGYFSFAKYAGRYMRAEWCPDLHHGLRLANEGDPAEALKVLSDALELAPGSARGFCVKSALLLQLGRIEDARKAAQMAVQLEPGDPANLVQLARVEHFAQNPAVAESIARSLIALFPWYVPAHHLLTEILEKSGEHLEACRAAERAAELRPCDAIGFERLARHRARTNDWNGAEAAARVAIKLSGSSVSALNTLAGVLREHGRHDEALITLREIIERGTDNPHVYGHLGQLLTGMGDLQGAEQAFRKAVEFAPRMAGFQNELAGILSRLGRGDEAVTILRDLIASGADNPHIHGHFGHHLLKSGDLDGAERAFRKAAELAPGAAGFQNELAGILGRLGRREEALAILSDLIASGTDNPHIHGHLGHQLLQAGDLDAAERAFRKAVELAPGTAGFRNELAGILSRLGRREEALAILRDLIASGTDNPHIHGHLGHQLLQAGDLGGAERAFRKAVELDVTVAGFTTSLAHVLERQDRLQEAYGMLEELVDRGSQDARVHAQLAHLLSRCGEFAAAERYVRSAIQIDPAVPEFHQMLTRILNQKMRDQAPESSAGHGEPSYARSAI